ncbi:MAG: sugar-binding protein [Planctomycetota bacterium]|jgi:putative multiple sugar transport system substrate-binding protein|nr:sugar-binding protein [Planctomycetota bacterium]
MKKLLTAVLCGAFAMLMTAAGEKVGVAMPTKNLERWNHDGANMKAVLEAKGYEVDLQYSTNNDISIQVNEIENLIQNGCKVLVIAAIDGSSLSSVLAGAKAANIPVIAYDRLIMNTDAVSYYASFDNFKLGEIQGQFIKDKLDLDRAAGPFNVELFTGSADDNNSEFYYQGAMSILKPFIDNGKLKVLSGQTTKAEIATKNWSTEEAQKRMENLLTGNNYGPDDVKLSAVLGTNDSIANGISTALIDAGYTPDNFPIVTGMDCDVMTVRNLLNGSQTMSIFKDTRILADKVVAMVAAILEGKEPEVNNTTDYNNGVKVIPSYLCDSIIVTKENIAPVLFDSGYYKAEQFK